jgi:hypothetical protein
VTFITLGQAKFWRPSGSDAHHAPAEFSAGSFAMLSPKEVARLEMAIVDRNRRSFRPDPDLEADSQTGWRDAVPHIRAVPRAFLPGRSNDADFVLGTQTVTHAVASPAACRISVPCHQTDSGDRGSPDSPPDDGPGSRQQRVDRSRPGGLFTPTTLPFAAELRPGREIRSLVRRREFLSVVNPPRVWSETPWLRL